MTKEQREKVITDLVKFIDRVANTENHTAEETAILPNVVHELYILAYES